MTSAPSPYAASHHAFAPRRARLMVALITLAWAWAACGNDDGFADNPDGSFGTGAGNYARDAGMDGAVRDMDASATGGGPVVSVRFLHAIPNTGALVVCHDPDGTGPMTAHVLAESSTIMRAEFGTRSAALRLPALSTGSLTLQRVAGTREDAGVDAGADDGGVTDPCAPSTREGTIPLPISGGWLSPRTPLSSAQIDGLDLLTSFVSDAPAITLLGTGVALQASEVERRARVARDGVTGDETAKAAAEELEIQALNASFSPRTLIQADPRADDTNTFSLAVLHAVADVPPASTVAAGTSVGGVRVCVTSGTLDLGALPRSPAGGIPFRVRTQIGSAFSPTLDYEFRAYAQADFDARQQECATTSLNPVARGSYSDFQPGKAYTLALIGAIAPTSLCSASATTLVRPSCSTLASELGARIEVLEDN